MSVGTDKVKRLRDIGECVFGGREHYLNMLLHNLSPPHTHIGADTLFYYH